MHLKTMGQIKHDRFMDSAWLIALIFFAVASCGSIRTITRGDRFYTVSLYKIPRASRTGADKREETEQWKKSEEIREN